MASGSLGPVRSGFLSGPRATGLQTRFRRTRSGFTLIELLVVIAIIGVLVGMLLPAVQQAREAARRLSCGNSFKQMALALHSHENSLRHYPTAFETDSAGADLSDWSVPAKLLPFVEQVSLGDGVREAIASGDSYENKTINGKKICNYRIDTLMCPSEIRAEPRGTDYYPLNVAANMGTGTILGSGNTPTGDGAFGVNFKGRPRHFTDGLSKTLALSEVRAWTPYVRDGGGLTAVPSGTDLTALQALPGTLKADTGHTEWCDGRVHQSGFTTGFPPNSVTPVNGNADGDFTSLREGGGRTGPCVAVVTSRSYHSGGIVNVAMMDGSVSTVSAEIPVAIWRAMGTRSNGESFSR